MLERQAGEIAVDALREEEAARSAGDREDFVLTPYPDGLELGWEDRLTVVSTAAIFFVLGCWLTGAATGSQPWKSFRALAHETAAQENLRAWLQADVWQGEALPQFQAALSRAQADLAQAPEQLPNYADALLALSTFSSSGSSEQVQQRMESARALAQLSLGQLLSGPAAPALQQHLAITVLPRLRRRTQPERQIALELLATRAEPQFVTAVLASARDRADPLRDECLRYLVRFPGAAVDSYLVERAFEKFDKEGNLRPFALLLERTRSLDAPLDPRAAEKLRPRLAAWLLATDWREVARAIELCQALPDEEAVPLWIDALRTWQKRAALGVGSKRLEHELVSALRERSGCSIGANADNWTTWWIARRQGRVEARDASADRGGEPRTQAAFFGLRPLSDRVTFIIDHSGSMNTGWGTTGHSRYVEAIDQMLRYLEAAGPNTRFNVVLFSDTALRSAPWLERADVQQLERARQALLSLPPAGGTQLRPAVELALGLGPDGSLPEPLIEADTIVVLCDGETAEGAGWVESLLERVREPLQVVFHCVLLGPSDDGVLSALARGTGGDFLRVGG